MKCGTWALVALLVCGGGCVYTVKLVPPHITVAERDVPNAAVFAVVPFKDMHPQKPYIGRTVQHCMMNGILVFGPISHKSKIPQ